MRRARAVGYWAAIWLVGVAMAAFIVFDVLDLDGSNLRRPTTGSALTADPAASETERLLVRVPEPSAAPGGAPAVARRSLPARVDLTGPGTRSPALRPHRTATHLQVWKDGRRDTPSAPDDPA